MPRPIIFASATLLLCLLAGGLTACSPRSATATLSIEAGFDPTSKGPDERVSTPIAKPVAEVRFDAMPKSILADELARQFAATVAFISPRDTFALRVTDNKTSLITTTRPEDENAAYTLAQSVCGQVVKVTDLATYFETVAEAAEHSLQPVVVLLYSDCLDDGDVHTATKRIETAAHRLAANPRIRAVLLIGLVRDTRPLWKGLPEMLACLNEGTGRRLYVQSEANMDPSAVARVLDAIRVTPLKTNEARLNPTAVTR